MGRKIALLDHSWASLEACGVCRGKDGKLYFYWQIVDETSVKEYLDKGQKFVCELDHVVSTLGRVHDCYPDELPSYIHEEFLKEWKPKVENPEVADLFLHTPHPELEIN